MLNVLTHQVLGLGEWTYSISISLKFNSGARNANGPFFSKKSLSHTFQLANCWDRKVIPGFAPCLYKRLNFLERLVLRLQVVPHFFFISPVSKLEGARESPRTPFFRFPAHGVTLNSCKAILLHSKRKMRGYSNSIWFFLSWLKCYKAKTSWKLNFLPCLDWRWRHNNESSKGRFRVFRINFTTVK